MVKGINFRRNSADIKASSFPLLKEAVKVFREYPDLRVEISGHTSTEGKRDFNMKLSRKRAESVKGFLVSAGIDEKRIGTVGYGRIARSPTTRPRKVRRRTGASSSACCRPERTSHTQPEPEDINPSPERKSKGGAKAKGKGKGEAAPKTDKADDKPKHRARPTQAQDRQDRRQAARRRARPRSPRKRRPKTSRCRSSRPGYFASEGNTGQPRG